MKNNAVCCSLVYLGFLALTAPPTRAGLSVGSRQKELVVSATALQLAQAEFVSSIEGREMFLSFERSVTEAALIESYLRDGNAVRCAHAIALCGTSALVQVTSNLVTGPLGPDCPGVVIDSGYARVS